MKKILLLIAAGFAFAGQPASAQTFECRLVAAEQRYAVSDVPAIPAGPSVPASVVAGAFADVLLEQGAAGYAACSADVNLISDELMRVNEWNANTLLERSSTFQYPVPTSVAVEAVAPDEDAAPAAEPEAAPPPVGAARDMQRDVVQPIREARREIVRIQQVPVSELTPAEKDFLANAPARLDAIESAFQNLPTSGPIPADLTDEQNEALSNLDTLTDDIDSLESDVSIMKYVIGILLIVVLSIVIVLLFGRGRSKMQVEAIVNAKLETVKLDDTFKVTMLADMAEIKSDVAGLKSRFKHDVKKADDTLKPVEMKALVDGAEFEYHLLVDGLPVSFDAKVIQHTPSGDALIKVAELQSPVTAKSLFGALADYFENGGALPALKLVNNP